MKQYIILLRAVNVSGKNLIKMADLKLHLVEAGFNNVQTYIQSGNIILNSILSKNEIKENLKQLIKEKFSLDVETIVVNKNLLAEALDKNPFPADCPPNRVFVTFYNQYITHEQILTLNDIDAGEEKFYAGENYLHFYLPEGAAKAKLSNIFFEAKLKIKATSRNINTIKSLLKMSQSH